MGMKQVIILRKDLNMRKGKMVAQGAHASVIAAIEAQGSEEFDEWMNGGMTKICVGVDSEAELLDIYAQAQHARLTSALIQDAGHTEFGGVPTHTAVAIGPASVDQIDKLTGHLKLL